MNWSLVTAGWVISLVTIPHLLLAKKRPIATLAWIWGILLFPYIGALAYLIIGTDRIRRRKLRRMRDARQVGRALAAGSAADLIENEAPRSELFGTLSNLRRNRSPGRGVWTFG